MRDALTTRLLLDLEDRMGDDPTVRALAKHLRRQGEVPPADLPAPENQTVSQLKKRDWVRVEGASHYVVYSRPYFRVSLKWDGCVDTQVLDDNGKSESNYHVCDFDAFLLAMVQVRELARAHFCAERSDAYCWGDTPLTFRQALDEHMPCSMTHTQEWDEIQTSLFESNRDLSFGAVRSAERVLRFLEGNLGKAFERPSCSVWGDSVILKWRRGESVFLCECFMHGARYCIYPANVHPYDPSIEKRNAGGRSSDSGAVFRLNNDVYEDLRAFLRDTT